MTAPQLVSVAASLSLLAGWRLYAAVFALGLAVRFGPESVALPLHNVAVLGHPIVLAVAGVAALAEALADKIAWIDSAWDAVHTLVRPVGGALLAFALVRPSDPAMEVVTLLLGGGAALAAHTAKAGTRALVNVSPEPLSNVAVSTAEDVVTGGALWATLAHPAWAAALAAVLAGGVGVLIWWSWRTIGALVARLRGWLA